MQRHLKRIVTITAATLASASVSNAAYQQLASLAQVTPSGAGSVTLSSGVIVGNTAFSALTGTSIAQISQTTGLGTAPAASTLTSNSTLTGAGSPSLSGQLFDSGTGYLSVLDNHTSEHQVLQINESTGAVTVYAGTSIVGTDNILAPTPVPGTPDLAWYDSTAKTVVSTNGAGNVLTTLISTSTLSAGTGSSSVNGMLLGLPNDQFLIENSTTKTIYDYNGANGSFTTLLTTANIMGVNGNVSPTILSTANFYGPDGNVYFADNNAHEILDFNPLNAASTLAVAVNTATISAAEGGSTTVGNLSWYNGSIAWDATSGPAAGFYGNVPEPGSLSLLAVGSIALLGRRGQRATR